MFKVGEIVKFKRSNGSWSIGIIKEIEINNYIIQWGTKDGLIGTKTVKNVFVKKLKRRRFLRYLSCFLVFSCLLLLDSYIFLKKVYIIVDFLLYFHYDFF